MELRDTLQHNSKIEFVVQQNHYVPYETLMKLKPYYPDEKIKFIRGLRDEMSLNSYGNKLSLHASKQIQEQCWTFWDFHGV